MSGSTQVAAGHYKIGMMWHRRGNQAAARQHLRDALDQDVSYEAAHFALASIYMSEHRWELALACCAAGLQHCDERARLHKLQIEAFEMRGRLADAFDHYQLRRLGRCGLELEADDLLCIIFADKGFERLPGFLAHYRQLGVAHFLVLCHDSAEITPTPSLHVWHAPPSDRCALVELLLRRYGINRWCLTVTPEQLLVYDAYETRPLNRFCRYLQANRWRAVSARYDSRSCTPLFLYDTQMVLDNNGNFLNLPEKQRADRQAALVANPQRASIERLRERGLLSAEKQSPSYAFPAIRPAPSRAQANESVRPRFSVMITVYDRLASVKKAVHSVAQQMAPDMQVEILNDGGLLEAELNAFLAELGEPRITLHCPPNELGHPHIFNLCIQRATGEWVHILHDDDWVEPGYYDYLRRGIATAPTAGALLCHHQIVGNEKTIGRAVSAFLERETPGLIDGWLSRIAIMCRLQFSSIVVKRAVYEKLGGFSAECGSAFDWEMWKRIATYYPVWYEPTQLVNIRRGDGTALTDTLWRNGQQVISCARTLPISQSYFPPAMAAQLLEKSREALARDGLHLAQLFAKQQDYAAVVANLNAALRVCPTPSVQHRANQLLQTIHQPADVP